MGLRREHGYWLWIGGPVAPCAAATTLGSLILVRRDRADDVLLLTHELVHVRQWRTLGRVGFLRRYLGAYLRWRLRLYPHWAAYRRIPIEIEADWRARRSLRLGGEPLVAGDGG